MSEADPTHGPTTTRRRIAGRLALAFGVVIALLLGMLASVAVLLSTQGGSRWLLAQVIQRISSDSLEIRHEAIQGSLLGGLTLHGLDIQMGDNRIRSGRLEVAWQPTALLTGTVVIDHLHAADLMVDWHTAPADPDAPSAPSPGAMLDALLPLPVGLQVARLEADGMEIELDDTLLPLRSFRMAVTLHDRQLDVKDLVLQAPPVQLTGALGLTLAGDYDLDASLAWEYRAEDGSLPPLSGQLDAGGNLNTLSIEHRLREPAQVASEGTVTVGLADSLNGVASPPPLTLDLQHTASSLALDEIGLSVPALAGWRIETLDMITRGAPDDLAVNGNLQVQAILPGGDNPPLELTTRWSSTLQGSSWRLGQLRAEARDNWLEIDGEMDWSGPLAVTASLLLEAPDPGAVYPLPDGLELQSLQTQADLQFTLPESGLSGEVVLQTLSAELNNQPLSGGGRLSWSENVLEINDLLIRSGENTLEANGLVGETLDASVSIDIPAISSLYPPAGGAATAQLTLSGTLQQLSAQTSASASGLTLNDWSLDTLQLDGQIDGEQIDAELSVEGVSGAGQQFQQITADIAGTLTRHTATLQAEGTPGRVELDVTGGLDSGRWTGRLDNSVVVSYLGRWQQQAPADLVVSADNSSLSRVCWQQLESSLCTRLDLSGDNVDGAAELQNYTLALFNHEQANQILRNFHDGELPADHVLAPENVNSPFRLPRSMALTGTLDASATVSGPLQDMQALQLEADAELADLAFYLQQPGEPLRVEPAENLETMAEEDVVAVEQILWEQADASLSFADGEWTGESSMVLYQEDITGSGVAMRGSADASVSLAPDGTLQGSVDLGFDDIAWIEALVPQLRNPTGRLQGMLSAGGTLEAPTLGADLALQDASTEVPALGLLLEDISLRLENPQEERFTLTGQLRSGTGTLQLDSEILRPLQQDRSLTLTLQGEDVQVTNLPDLQASLSPDLTLEGNLDSLDLNGTLHVPVLDLTIDELPESAVDVSADAVITTDAPGVRNAALAERGLLQNTTIRGTVNVSLGDNVHVSGFGLDADLTGSLDITLRPDATPLTYGELEVVDGRFETYGQTLQIEQGKLQFLGSYNNPALNIRATRQVAGNRVGVQMTGTLRNIRSELFSTPALPDADVLAMLITGRPLADAGEQERPSLVGAIARLGINQGQGLTDQIRGQLGLDTLALDAGRGGDLQDSSLTLGKYITPRIFVQYAVGLFDTENTLAIDYSLTEHLKLEAQSGQSQSLDLIYEMEQ